MFINNNKLKHIQQDLQTTSKSNNNHQDQLAESTQPNLSSDKLATDQGYTVMSKIILPSDSYRTVEYYKLHKGERKLKLEECAKYVQTNIGYENCKNAKAS